LTELITLTKNKIDSSKKYRTRFSVCATKYGKDLASSVKIVTPKTGEIKDANAKSTVVKGKQEFTFFSEFLVKDHSNLLSNQFVRIVLKLDDNSEFFPGISASDILKKKKAQDTVAACFKNLEKFNVWIEASVSIS